MKRFTGLVQKLSQILDKMAGFCIAATMAVVVINIVLRAVLGKPLLGTMDYVNLLTALAIGMGLAYCALQNGQIAVDFIIEKLPCKPQAIIDILTNLTALLFWAVSVWYMADYARTLTFTGLVSATTQIPIYPVVYIIAFGLMALCLVIVLKISDAVRKVLS